MLPCHARREARRQSSHRELVGERARAVEARRQRGDRVGRVDRHHDVGEHEPPAGTRARARTRANSDRFSPASRWWTQSALGTRSNGPAGSGVLQSGHVQIAPAARQAGRAPRASPRSRRCPRSSASGALEQQPAAVSPVPVPSSSTRAHPSPLRPTSSSWKSVVDRDVLADHLQVGARIEVELPLERRANVSSSTAPAAHDPPLAVCLISRAGRPPSTPSRAARRRRSPCRRPRRIASGTSSSARASGPPARLALDCSTGQRTAGQRRHHRHPHPERRRIARRTRAGSAPRDWAAAASRAPGSSRSSAARVRAPELGQRRERQLEVEEHHRRGLVQRPALEARTAARPRPGSARSQASP